MTAQLSALTIAAASVGFIHTILGPDHYLPFAVLSWARNWSAAKTGLITALCGLGHVVSSVILGLVGVSLGLAIRKLEFVESFRGQPCCVAAYRVRTCVYGLGLAPCVPQAATYARSRPRGRNSTFARAQPLPLAHPSTRPEGRLKHSAMGAVYCSCFWPLRAFDCDSDVSGRPRECLCLSAGNGCVWRGYDRHDVSRGNFG